MAVKQKHRTNEPIAKADFMRSKQNGSNIQQTENHQVGELVQELLCACDYYAANYVQQVGLHGEATQALQNAKQELDDLQESYAQLKEKSAKWDQKQDETIDALVKTIQELVETADNFAALLEQQQKENSKLKIQTSYLDAQNQRYRRTFERITQAWWGKIALKIYHFLCRVGLLRRV